MSLPSFRVVSKIGKGAYGSVYEAIDEETGEKVALKRIKLDSTVDGIPCTALREISILLHMKHQNIVSVHKIMHTSKHIQIAFEYCKCDLGKYMKQFPDRCMPYSQVLSFTKQILQAISYMHSKNIMHRDIKPPNILIHDSNIIKICDFGLSRSSSLPVSGLSSDVVTRWYRAPEVLKKSQKYDTKIDVWSVGCVVVEMLTGMPLFPCNTEEEMLERIEELIHKNNGEMLKHEIGYVDKGMLELIFRMLDPNPSTRITADEALTHRALSC